MLQACPCVRLHCDQCGALLADPEDTDVHGRPLATHYPTHDTALTALTLAGWHVGARGCVRCPTCGPIRLQHGLCVRLRCDRCGEALTDTAGWEAHYPTETHARANALTAGWRTTPRGRWVCPTCGPLLSCQAHGHAFTPWRLLRLDGTPDPHDRSENPSAAGLGAMGAVLSRVYRYCTRCGHHHSLGTTWLLTENPPRATTTTTQAITQALAAAAGAGVA